MALRTNSKKALENIRKYITTAAEYIESEYRPEVYGPEDLTTWKGTAKAIYTIFRKEKQHVSRMSEQALFTEWAAGLALNLFDYFYECNAGAILAEMLEETPEEAAKYTEEKSAELLTSIIYREVRKAA